MFSVWQRPQIVWGGGDEAGSGGEGSKGRSKNEMKTQRKINAELDKKKPDQSRVNELVAQRERDRAATARNTAGTKYTGLKDMFDGGGPGASGPQFRGGPFSGVTNPFAGGGGGSGSTPTPAPRQRIGTKGMTSAQRKALTDAGYEVTKGGSVKKNGGTVAGSNFSGSREVDAIMNSGPLSGERGSFGDAFAAARKKAGGDGGTFTFGGETFTTNIDRSPKVVRPKLRPDTVAPAAAPVVDYDSLYQDAAYGPGGIGAAPFGLPAPQTQAANFYTDPSASTAAVYPQAPDFSRTDLPPGSYEVASSGNAFEKFLNSVGLLEDKNTGEVSTTYNRTDGPIGTLLPDMGSDPSDNREPRGMYAADTTAALEPFGGRGPIISDTTAPAPKALTYNEILERIGDTSLQTGVPVDTRTDIERYDDSGQLKPGFSTALQARIDDPTQDLIEAGRERSRDDALRSLRTVNPQAPEDQGFGGAGLATLMDQSAAVNPVRAPETQAILDRNEARFLKQFEKDKGYDTVALGGVMKGLGLTAKGLADQTEFFVPRETTMDPIAERLYGGSARGDLPSVVGDQNVVAGALDRFGDTTDRLYERMMGSVPQSTRDALEAEIFKDQSLKGVNTEALKAQAVQQLGTMVPMFASMINPVTAVTTGAGMTAGDVNDQTREYVRKRYEESKKAGGELGQITPGQLEYLITSAQRKATPFASAIGGVTGGLAKAGLPLPTILGEVLSEVGLEPSIAEVATATTVDDGIQPQNLYAPRFLDAGLLAAGSGLAISGPASLATNRANIPTKAQDYSQTIEAIGTPATETAVADVITGPKPEVLIKDPVQPKVGLETVLPQDNLFNIPGVVSESVVPPRPAPPQSDAPVDRGPIPGDQSYDPETAAAKTMAETVKKTGEAKPADITPEAQAEFDLLVPGGKPKSVGAAAGRSGVVDAILRKKPDYLPFGFDFNLGTDLDTRLQDIAFQQAEANRAAGKPELGATDADAGVVPKGETQSELLLGDMGSTRQYSIYDSDGNIRDGIVPSRFAPTAKGQYTGEQIAAQMNRERLARQERGETEAAGKAAGVEAIEASDAALLSGLPVDPAGIGSLRNFPSNIPLVDSPAAQRDRQIANAQREKARLEAEAMRPLEIAQNAILNSQTDVSEAENEVALANELATQMEQLQAVNEVIAAGNTTVPKRQGPPAPEFPTAETQAQLAAIATPVEPAIMDPLGASKTPRIIRGEKAPEAMDAAVPVTDPEISFEEAVATVPRPKVRSTISALKSSAGTPPIPGLAGGVASVYAPSLEQQYIKSIIDSAPTDVDATQDALEGAQQASLDLPPVSDPSTEAIMKGVVSLINRTDARSKAPDPSVITPDVTLSDPSATLEPLVLTDQKIKSDLGQDPFSLENRLARQRARFAEGLTSAQNIKGQFFKGIGDADMPASTVETKDKTSRGIPAALKKTLVPTSVTVPDIGELRDVEDVTSTTSPSDNREPRTMYDDTSDGTGGEGTGTGTGTQRESAPKYVPVDMNNENNDDLGCPSGYARVFDPATGQPICGRIDEPSAPGPAAPAEEAEEEEEDGVVIDIPITERPKISPYYVPEMVESNYTPYVPGRRARTQ